MIEVEKPQVKNGKKEKIDQNVLHLKNISEIVTLII